LTTRSACTMGQACINEVSCKCAGQNIEVVSQYVRLLLGIDDLTVNRL
jgi:hypothetical protein